MPVTARGRIPMAAPYPRGFYRLCRPGLAVEDARAKWAALVTGDYQFQLEHVRSPDQPYLVSGTVTASGGQKVVPGTTRDGQ